MYACAAAAETGRRGRHASAEIEPRQYGIEDEGDAQQRVEVVLGGAARHRSG